MKEKFKNGLNKYLHKTDNIEIRVKYEGCMKYIPLILCGGFFLFTILLFVFGPLNWNIDNPFKLYGFLITCCIALITGYLLSVKNGKVFHKKSNININNVIFICCIVYFVIYIPTLLATTGKWYPDIYTGIFDTGKAYRISKYYNEHGSQLALYIRMLLSPFIIMITPVTLFFMPKLNKINKILGVITIVLTVFLSISQGVNKAVADFAAQIVVLLFILFFAKPKEDKGKNIIYKLKIISLIVLIIISFFGYYSNGMKNRLNTDISMSKSNTDTNQLNPKKLPKKNANEEEVLNQIDSNSKFSVAQKKDNYFLVNLFPQKVESMLVYLTSYLSHGYKGLSYALDKDFTSTYGLGFSDFFRHNLLKPFHALDKEKEIINRTYYGKTSENGWATGEVWSTFFVYPASDVSFIGTIFLIFLVGYLFGLSWKDALITHNPFAIVSFVGFCSMIFYFSANNQMFQGGENFIGFSTMLFIWLYPRRKLFKDKKEEQGETTIE